MATPPIRPDERWRNVEVRITYPIPSSDYNLYADRRFDNLADTLMDLFPQAVVSGGVVWSDADAS